MGDVSDHFRLVTEDKWFITLVLFLFSAGKEKSSEKRLKVLHTPGKEELYAEQIFFCSSLRA
jgi:hypothetical protein